MSHLSASDPNISTVVVLSIVFACTVLIGVWAAFEGTRLARGVRSGEF